MRKNSVQAETLARDEIDIHSRLEHPNICRVIENFEDERPRGRACDSLALLWCDLPTVLRLWTRRCERVFVCPVSL